jgi:hypothetical protein
LNVIDNVCVNTSLPGCIDFNVTFSGTEPSFTCIGCDEKYFLIQDTGQCSLNLEDCGKVKYHHTYGSDNSQAIECVKCNPKMQIQRYIIIEVSNKSKNVFRISQNPTQMLKIIRISLQWNL